MKNIVVLVVLIVCGFGGVKFYLPKFIDARIHDQVINATAEIQKRNEQLAEIVKSLDVRQQKLDNHESMQLKGCGLEIDFNRWSCWCDLKDKLLYGGEYSDELIRFRAMFSDCSDLMAMVDSVVSEQNNETKEFTLINNLRKFFKIRSVNERKIERITGYAMLSSIRKVEENGRRE